MNKILASIQKTEFHVPRVDFARRKVGIQIGEKAIKIVEVRKNRKHWETKQTIIEHLPKGMVREGRILQPNFLGVKIKEILSNYKIHVNKVSVFVEELPFFIRRVQLPPMSKKEREQAIYFHTQLEIPVDPSELTIRYLLNQRDDQDGTQSEYIIFAVYSSLIEKVVQTMHAAGLSIYTFGLEPDAIIRGLKEKDIISDKKGSFMIVRTDTQRMLIAIYTNGKLMKSRYVPFSLNKSEWEQEIERTLISWNGRYSHNRIQEVMLLGEKEHWDEVKQRIEAFMPISVRLVTSPFTACLGISLKNADENDFYTDHHMLHADRVSITTKVIIPMVIVAGITLAYTTIRPLLLENEINSLREEVAQNHKVIDLAQENTLHRDKNQNLLAIKQNIENKQLDILLYIRTAASYQPENITLMGMVFSKDVIRLSGEGKNQKEVIQFLKGLQNDSLYQDAQLTQSSEGTNGVQFVIEINRNQTSEEQDNAKTK